MPNLKVLRIHPEAKLPQKVFEADACFDLYCLEDFNIEVFETKLIRTGLRFEIPDGFDLDIREKSGLATKGIIIGGGVVDSVYRGEIQIVMRFLDNKVMRINSDGKPVAMRVIKFEAGDKIAQCKLVSKIPTAIVEITESEFNANTERSSGGFGSSGR